MIQDALSAELCYESTLGWLMSDKEEGFLEEVGLSRSLKFRQDLEWGENREEAWRAHERA